ncbi:hypothetical protein DXV76_10160 [Rhodobacteraceae bacterium CCMM004]|nr:hypothetical protein DXV76_10160 [Rhodobacteraceae bacterium CCMM004]
MRRLPNPKAILAAMLAMSVGQATTTSAGQRDYTDTDWTVTLHDNCGLPVPSSRAVHADRQGSVRWTTVGKDRQLIFHLRRGDRGRCRSDDRPRHGAPFWERAELRQIGALDPLRRHRISLTAKFADGFIGRRETFLQIHGWTGDCPSAPLAMLQMHRRALRATLLTVPPSSDAERRGTLRPVPMDRIDVTDLRDSDTAIVLDLDMTARPYLASLTVNGQTLFSERPVHAVPCAVPRIKLGIYRPGGINPGRSTLIVDDIRVDSTPPPGETLGTARRPTAAQPGPSAIVPITARSPSP